MSDDCDWLLNTYHALLLAGGDHVPANVSVEILECLKNGGFYVFFKTCEFMFCGLKINELWCTFYILLLPDQFYFED